MHNRLPYAKMRLSSAIDQFLNAQTRQEKVLAARWVSAWALFNEFYSVEASPRRPLRPSPH